MFITINPTRIIDEVRRKAHFEVQPIPDAEARFDARAGLEKMDDLEQSLLVAELDLQAVMGRFLVHDWTEEVEDLPGLPQSFAYELVFGERRMKGKLPALAGAMHDFLVNKTLEKHFNMVTQTQLADRHADLAEKCANSITVLLYTKNPPIV